MGCRELQYYFSDGVSSDSAAHFEYSPFGKTTVASGTIPNRFAFRFSSEYHDSETGLVYYNYRYYSPDLGRWLNRDPIGERGGWNLYVFVYNNTVSYFDDLGEKIRTSVGGYKYSNLKVRKIATEAMKNWSETAMDLLKKWAEGKNSQGNEINQGFAKYIKCLLETEDLKINLEFQRGIYQDYGEVSNAERFLEEGGQTEIRIKLRAPKHTESPRVMQSNMEVLNKFRNTLAHELLHVSEILMRLKQMEEENSEDISECLCKELEGILGKQQLTQFRKEGRVRKTLSEAIKSELESKDYMGP